MVLLGFLGVFYLPDPQALAGSWLLDLCRNPHPRNRFWRTLVHSTNVAGLFLFGKEKTESLFQSFFSP